MKQYTLYGSRFGAQAQVQRCGLALVQSPCREHNQGWLPRKWPKLMVLGTTDELARYTMVLSVLAGRGFEIPALHRRYGGTQPA